MPIECTKIGEKQQLGIAANKDDVIAVYTLRL
jgi:hypothetical protein